MFILNLFDFIWSLPAWQRRSIFTEVILRFTVVFIESKDNLTIENSLIVQMQFLKLKKLITYVWLYARL